MRATIAALLVCLLLAATASAALLAVPAAGSPSEAATTSGERSATAVVGAQGTAEQGGGQGEAAAQEWGNGLGPAETLEVQVRDDGDARFALEVELPAATEEEEAAFERTADDFRDGELQLGLSFFRTTVQDVDEETERNMQLGATNRRASLDGDTGRLVQEFTWTNFAVASDDRVEVGDGFRTADGVWLRSLDEGQRLVVHAPDGYGVDHSEPKSSVRGNTVIWQGPETFEEGDFETVFERSEPVFSGGWLPIAAIGFVILLATAFLLATRLRGADGPKLPDVSLPVLSRSTPPRESENGTRSTGDHHSTDGSGDTAVRAGSDAAATELDASESEDEAVDPELLSDEERVERLLERNGGRMKQARIVDETGWSNAKVSQLLSEMAEADRVDKLRIGRENLISLPDEDVTAME